MVNPADVLDHPVAAVLRQVTGAVQPRTAFAERVGNKTQCRQVATLQVAPGQAGTANIQLTDAAFGHRVQFTVEQVPRQVGYRFANRAAGVQLEISHRQRTVGDVHRGFGDAVHVDQLWRAVAKPFEPWAQALDVQRLAAEYHVAQGIGP